MRCKDCGMDVKYRIDLLNCPHCESSVDSIPTSMMLTCDCYVSARGVPVSVLQALRFERDERDYHLRLDSMDQQCSLFYKDHLLGMIIDPQAVLKLQTIIDRIIYPIRLLEIMDNSDPEKNKFRITINITYHEKRSAL